jgi:hypothetical protein
MDSIVRCSIRVWKASPKGLLGVANSDDEEFDDIMPLDGCFPPSPSAVEEEAILEGLLFL